jgi:Holliday junction resolvase
VSASDTESGKNEAERWFERYLAANGYSYEYEPDLGVGKQPDFVTTREGVEVICEVKAFEKSPHSSGGSPGRAGRRW